MILTLGLAPNISRAADCPDTVKGGFVPLACVSDSPKLSTLYDDSKSGDLVTYLNSIFKVAISAGAILAVLRLAYAGYLYMGGDMWGNKQEARKMIQDVFLGLFLLLAVFIILEQINPNLLNLKIFMPPVDKSLGGSTAAPAFGGSEVCPGGCVPIPNGIAVKTASPGACRGTPPCKVASRVADKLSTLAGKLMFMPGGWYVSEAWPPTVAHSGPKDCHFLATCFDANISEPKTGPQIKRFIEAAKNSDLNAKWEIAPGRKDYWISQGVPSDYLLITGPGAEHFHVSG